MSTLEQVFSLLSRFLLMRNFVLFFHSQRVTRTLLQGHCLQQMQTGFVGLKMILLEDLIVFT